MELLMFWVITGWWQITLRHSKHYVVHSPFALVASFPIPKYLWYFALWGGKQEVTSDKCSSFCGTIFILSTSFPIPELLLQLQPWLWRVTPRRNILGGLWQNCCWMCGTCCDLCHLFEPQPQSCTFYQEYSWICNRSEDIWPINNSKLSIFPAVFLSTYHLLMFCWPGNNIVYGTSSIKVLLTGSRLFPVWYLENKLVLPSLHLLCSHPLLAQRSFVLHFKCLKLLIFNYWFQNCYNVIEFVILFSLPLPHPFVFFSALYPFTVLRRILMLLMLLLSSSQWEIFWGSLLDHLPWDPLMLLSQL